MRDPVVRDALACVHAQPGHPWTTQTLAAATSVSRATLSRRFRSALGQTPGAYLTQWRIDLASVRLRDTDEPVESISRAVGYGSAHAFSRAFRRARGTAPGEYRSRLRK
ncbi:helix-turn-helix domain-containing protein [Streptomyces minutiscleroticus]